MRIFEVCLEKFNFVVDNYFKENEQESRRKCVMLRSKHLSTTSN